MYCANCGTKLPDNQTICPNCGADLANSIDLPPDTGAGNAPAPETVAAEPASAVENTSAAQPAAVPAAFAETPAAAADSPAASTEGADPETGDDHAKPVYPDAQPHNPRGFSNKRNVIILIIAALAALGVTATAISVGVGYSNSKKLTSALDAAQRYLEEHNYEQAILEFKAALKIDPMCVEAYLGLAEAYEALGDIENAVKTLEEGYERTKDEIIFERLSELKKLLDDLFSDDLAETAEVILPETAEVETLGELDVLTTEEPETEEFDIPIDTVEEDDYIDDSRIVQAAAGFQFSAAITEDGELFTWGQNEFGQLGNGTTNPDGIYNPTVISIDGGKRVAYAALGGCHTAVITEDGELYTWGENLDGQLGDGTTEGRLSPTRITVDGGKKVVCAALGAFHTAVITEDGALYTWGRNTDGQLGDGTTENRLTPTRITIDGGKKVVAVAAGSYFTAAITEDGALYTWGFNDYGQLGDGTYENRLTPTRITIDGDKRVVGAALGFNAGAAITEDGSLYTWGCNNYGQLGDGTYDSRFTPAEINVGGGKKVISVKLGLTDGAAITEDGMLYAWGGVYDSETDGEAVKNPPAPTRVDVADGQRVSAVTLGEQCSAAITEDGGLYTWGANDYGQLGDGTNEDNYTPTRIFIGSGNGEAVGLLAYGTKAEYLPLGSVWTEGNVPFITPDNSSYGIMNLKTDSVILENIYQAVYYNDNAILATMGEVSDSGYIWEVFDSTGAKRFEVESSNDLSVTDDGRYICCLTNSPDASAEMNLRGLYSSDFIHDLHIVDENNSEVFFAPYVYAVYATDTKVFYLCYNENSLNPIESFSGVKNKVSTMVLDLTTMTTTEISEKAGAIMDDFRGMRAFGDWIVYDHFTPGGPRVNVVNYITGERKKFSATFDKNCSLTQLNNYPNGIRYGVSTGLGYVFLDENFNDAFTGFTFPEDYAKYFAGSTDEYESDVLPKYFAYEFVGEYLGDYTIAYGRKALSMGGLQIIDRNLLPVTGYIDEAYYDDYLNTVYNDHAYFRLADSGEWVMVNLSDIVKHSEELTYGE